MTIFLSILSTLDFLGISLPQSYSNIFFGHGLPDALRKADESDTGGTVFGYHVADPERYGVVAFDEDGRAKEIVEKPKVPPSSYAITGLYLLDHKAPARARTIKPSARGELEITSLLDIYLKEGSLNVETMGRGFAWLDTGTHGSLLDAANFVRTLEQRQAMLTGSPDEIAFQSGWITRKDFQARIKLFEKTRYGTHLAALIKDHQQDVENCLASRGVSGNLVRHENHSGRHGH